MAAITVVFDFDKTIVEPDSDNWVIDEFEATDLFNELLPTMPWNSLMDRMMEELHSQGKTMEDVKEVLRRIPIHPRIVPYVDSHSCPHASTCCPPNMCKGMIIEKIKASTSQQGKVMIYLGDGVGDFCSTLKLDEGDVMMPRKEYPVWDLICKNREIIKPEIHEWNNGEDMEQILVQLVEEKMTNTPTLEMLPPDCKYPMPASLPQPLTVNQ